MRLVVTGGRNYTDEATVRWALNTLHQRDGIELLHQRGLEKVGPWLTWVPCLLAWR